MNSLIGKKYNKIVIIFISLIFLINGTVFSGPDKPSLRNPLVFEKFDDKGQSILPSDLRYLSRWAREAMKN